MTHKTHFQDNSLNEQIEQLTLISDEQKMKRLSLYQKIKEEYILFDFLTEKQIQYLARSEMLVLSDKVLKSYKLEDSRVLKVA